MKQATLVVMAAGIGSRFKDGIKQLEPVGPHGELIIDYSIYDALEAGFSKVVFIIRKDIEEEFRWTIGDRIADKVQVEYVYQELDDIPGLYKSVFAKRTKPWGTGQAILNCKDVVDEPFLVINADDYYGKEAYRKAFQYLTSRDGPSEKEEHCDDVSDGSPETAESPPDESADPAEESGEDPPEDAAQKKLQGCMVAYILKNTLSENGSVTRGVCTLGDDEMLRSVTEVPCIEKRGDKAVAIGKRSELELNPDSLVSMNMWGLTPEIFPVLEEGFTAFLEQLKDEKTWRTRLKRKKNRPWMTREYLLPTIIGNLLSEDRIEIKVLRSDDSWFGVTYKQDKGKVVEKIKELVDVGAYPGMLRGNET